MRGAPFIERTIYWRKQTFIKLSHVEKNKTAAVTSVMSRGPRCFEDNGIGGDRRLFCVSEVELSWEG